MRPSIVIVADDLTGAADCGVACTAAGLSTVVVLSEAMRARDLAAEAIAFDADTRRQSPEAAGAATELAIQQLCAGGGVRVLYKKIDSTLRGNVAVEIAAARSSSTGLLPRGETSDEIAPAPPLAIVAPAFPATGRTTCGGRMFLRGIPLEESEVWRNERISGVADVPALLQTAAGLRTASVALETIHADVETLALTLAKHAAADVEAVVCDAEAEEDLSAIAHAAARLRRPVVFAGSAGLARHLPQAFGLIRKRESPPNVMQPARPPEPDSPISGSGPAARAPLLFVVGSMSQVSREQLLRLANESGVRVLTVSPATLRAGPGAVPWEEARRLMDEALRGSDDVALALDLGEGINLGESAYLSGALAQFLLPLAWRFSGLFCTGGETARALLTAAGAVGIRLVGEVEPGVPLGTMEGWHNLPIVTKAGAFGTPQTLVRCRAALRRLLAQQT
ncbi:MAG: four-carbon acid sugar kinase family protein [Alphaproteobacteria bacterium]|nr:four-carbon acid sugar kinase family protein [Alphaproteobacteria bacterium]